MSAHSATGFFATQLRRVCHGCLVGCAEAVTPGTTSTFYPDFLWWGEGIAIAIDTTGGHLLAEKAARKLLSVQVPDGVKSRILIRFVSEGRWSASPQLAQDDSEGFTVWQLSPNQERRAIHVEDIDAAVARAVRPPR